MTRTTKLSPAEKQHAVSSVVNRTNTVTEMANYFGVHPRTIYRALEESGEGMAQTGRKPSAGKKALEIMARHGISVEQLDSVLTQAESFSVAKRPSTPSKTAALFHPAPR